MSDGESKGSGKLGLWSWALYDWAGQSYATVIQTFVFAAYFTNRIAENAEKATTDWSLTVGFTSFCVGICGPVLGAVADRAGRRKPYVIGFILLCALGTAAMWFIHPVPDHRNFALILLAVATFGTQMSIIFYNAMLGDLVPRSRYGLWSGRGWALGYAGGIVCLIAVLALFVHDSALLGISQENALHIRMSFPFVSLWLIVFVLPLCWWTPDRSDRGLPLRQSVREGLGQLKRSFGNLGQYRTVLRFLIARAFYMDGLATVLALGGVYAALCRRYLRYRQKKPARKPAPVLLLIVL